MNYYIYYTKDEADDIYIFGELRGEFAGVGDYFVKREGNRVKLFRIVAENSIASEAEVAMLLQLTNQKSLLVADGVTSVRWATGGCADEAE